MLGTMMMTRWMDKLSGMALIPLRTSEEAVMPRRILLSICNRGGRGGDSDCLGPSAPLAPSVLLPAFRMNPSLSLSLSLGDSEGGQRALGGCAFCSVRATAPEHVPLVYRSLASATEDE